MDNIGGIGFGVMNNSAKRKRSVRLRHPLDESQSHIDYCENSSLSSTPFSDSVSNQCASGASYTNLSEAETILKMREEGQQFGESSASGFSKLKKVKLKVGGITHTIHAKNVSEGSSLTGSSSTKSSHSSDSIYTQHKLINQDNSDRSHSSCRDQGSKLRAIPWKDFAESGFSLNKTNISSGKMPEPSLDIERSSMYQLARKSKRVPKKRFLGDVFGDEEDDADDEIRYLEKLRTSRLALNYGAEYDDEDDTGSKKQMNISMVSHGERYGYNGDSGYRNRSKVGVLSRPGRSSEDTDYFEEEGSLSDDEPELKKKNKIEETDFSGDFEREMAIITRQQALKKGRTISLVEFPDGLPPAPPKKKKENLSEVEQQLKKAEAAQRRRMQMEKANREAEAEAIRKILGVDSSRKKQEEKIKKRQEEAAQERAANSILAPNAVRWVIGPSGTIVTFPYEIGLPSIFGCKSCSYPPPREKCARPSCTNAYKYRDSKSKLPLCSLQCYKAINGKIQTLAAC